mgnify:CR=1 FL=1|tara:strand:+ start:88 stop:336 length:249 start_codon:yes stop_codon:yes gene_type:complete
MPGQHIIWYVLYLVALSLFYILFKPLINILKEQTQCGDIAHCTDTLGYLNAFEPYFLFVGLIIGTLWLIIKGINVSERDVLR